MKFIKGDCIEEMKKMEPESVDIVVTSPPYNIEIDYGLYKDNLSPESYLEWTADYIKEIKRLLKPNGSLFLNVGFTCVKPWIAMDVANVVRPQLILQNQFSWVKSVAIGEKTYGHVKPVNSNRFVNNTHEPLFHFTKSGKVNLNKKAIGVPFMDQRNRRRFGNGDREDLHCIGNTWHIPYQTLRKKGKHPAIFPEALVENCIRLAGYNKDTVVLDPFVGTGTTLVVAKKLGINGIGIDLNLEYLDFTKERIVDYTRYLGMKKIF